MSVALKKHVRASGHLPTSFFQKLMIADALDPDTSPMYHQHFTVRWAVRITPKVSERTLRRAFDKLVARHDSLRLRFVNVGDDWRAEILPAHPVGMIIGDLGDLSPEAQTAEITARANTPMTAFSNPMFEMHLLKCGSAGDVILIRAHHAIIDGYSVIVLMEELLKLALNMPLSGGAASHEAFIEQSERRGPSRRHDNDRYWEQALLPAPDPLRIGRVARNMPPISRRNVGRTHVLENILSKDDSEALDVFARRAGVTAFAVVHAAFCETICDLAGQDEVIMCSWLGRQDASLRNFIGSDTSLIAQKYRKTGADLMFKAREVSAANHDAVKALPSDMLLPESPLVAQLAEKGVTLWRFGVHNAFPSGRISNSPFKKLFLNGLREKVSLGFVSIERLEFVDECDAEFEIFVRVNYLPSGTNVTITADAAAYERSGLEQMARHMIAKL